MCDQLADEVAVGAACRELALAAVVLEEVAGVREVEVSGEEHRMAEFARLVDEWMAKRHLVFSDASRRVGEQNRKRQ